MRSLRFERVFLAAMFLLIALFAGFFVSDYQGPQANVFYGKTTNYMADYYNVASYTASRNPYYFGLDDPMSGEHAYPPLAYLVFYPLSRVADFLHQDAFEAGHSTMGMATSAFFMFLISGVFFLLLYETYDGKKPFKFLLSLALMLSGVFLATYERGNIMILAAALCGFFLLNYQSENKLLRELALIALALSAGLKGYPAFLGILLLFDKRFKESFRLMLYGAAAIFLPFAFFAGGFANIPVWLANLKSNTEAYEFANFLRFNFRYWFIQLPDFQSRMGLYALLKRADLIAAVLAVASSFFHKKHWKKVMQLLLVIMILPANSAIYVATYLFPGILLFFNEREHDARDWIYLTLFVVLLNPFQILSAHQNLTADAINLSAYLLLFLLTAESLAAGAGAWRNRLLKKA